MKHVSKKQPALTWINIDGFHEVDFLKEFGKEFDIHPLTLEDIVNTNQCPKVEQNGDCLYICLVLIKKKKK